jgi:hypothetical protein
MIIILMGNNIKKLSLIYVVVSTIATEVGHYMAWESLFFNQPIKEERRKDEVDASLASLLLLFPRLLLLLLTTAQAYKKGFSPKLENHDATS